MRRSVRKLVRKVPRLIVGFMVHTKSVKWTWPSASRRTLSGLTSRCMMPCPCMYLKAQPSSDIQNLTASSVKVFLEMWNRRSPPLMRSTTRYLWPTSTTIQNPRASRRAPGVRRDVHVFYILKTVPQVADEGVVHMFEHAALANDVSHAFGSNDCGASQTSVTRTTKTAAM